MHKGGNKEAFSLAIEFFKGNIALSLGAIGILIAVALLQLIPGVGVVFAFAYPILSLAVQVYVGRQVPEVKDDREMGTVAAHSTLSDLFLKHLDIAAGAFLGFFTIMLLLGLLFVLLFSGSVDMNALATDNTEAFMASVNVGAMMGGLTILLLLVMWLGYLMPGVMGRVILSENFIQALRRSFLFFSPSFWKRTFNKEYFLLVLVWSIVVFIAGLVASWLFASIFLSPVALILLYGVALYNAAVYVFAAQILSE